MNKLIQDWKEWTKVYLIVALLPIPLSVYFITPPFVMFMEGTVNLHDMSRGFVLAEAVALFNYILLSLWFLLKALWMKLRSNRE